MEELISSMSTKATFELFSSCFLLPLLPSASFDYLTCLLDPCSLSLLSSRPSSTSSLTSTDVDKSFCLGDTDVVLFQLFRGDGAGGAREGIVTGG